VYKLTREFHSPQMMIFEIEEINSAITIVIMTCVIICPILDSNL